MILRTYEEKEPEKRKKSAKKRSMDVLTSAGCDLFEELRRLRQQIARAESLPPYIVFNDRTLIDMCVKLPADEAGLLEVSGVGENKQKKYGEEFLRAIKSFLETQPDAVISMETESVRPENDGRAKDSAALKAQKWKK